MTLAQIRRRVNALKRKFALELAILRLRRIAEAVADNWDLDEPPEPHDVIQRVAKAGFRLSTFMRLQHYLKDIRSQGDVPEPRRIVTSLLPWASQGRYREFFNRDLPALARQPHPQPGSVR